MLNNTSSKMQATHKQLNAEVNKQILPRWTKSWKWFISRYFFNQNSTETETRLSTLTDYFCIFWLNILHSYWLCATLSHNVIKVIHFQLLTDTARRHDLNFTCLQQDTNQIMI